jgi:hypothetical protein
MNNVKCTEKGGWQIFSGAPQMISAGGILTGANQQVANSATETAVVTETVYGYTLNTVGQTFRVTLVGEISSSGSGDITLTLRYGTTDILAVVTTALANEDDKPFKLEYFGRVLTAGATGKVLCTGLGYFFQGTPLTFMTDTANTGATVDLTADGSLNVTAHWDNASADDDIIVTAAAIEFFD